MCVWFALFLRIGIICHPFIKCLCTLYERKGSAKLNLKNSEYNDERMHLAVKYSKNIPFWQLVEPSVYDNKKNMVLFLVCWLLYIKTFCSQWRKREQKHIHYEFLKRPKIDGNHFVYEMVFGWFALSKKDIIVQWLQMVSLVVDYVVVFTMNAMQ